MADRIELKFEYIKMGKDLSSTILLKIARSCHGDRQPKNRKQEISTWGKLIV